jgi:hypothetical protein
MKRSLITTALVTLGLFATSSVFAASAACEAKAVDKNGKPLAGAAKASFMKKCEAESGGDSCEAKAVDKNGKPLAGAAKASSIKKCEADKAAAKKPA